MKKEKTHRPNIAFIDGQNLHMGTAKRDVDPWTVDLYRFKKYLTDKYHVKRAYYYIGLGNEDHGDLYDLIQHAGFILKFRQHNSSMTSAKKATWIPISYSTS